jgi:hypothetical protein
MGYAVVRRKNRGEYPLNGIEALSVHFQPMVFGEEKYLEKSCDGVKRGGEKEPGRP